MSMYYSPEIVKMLMAERLREAQEAGRAARSQSRRTAVRPSLLAASIGRVFAGRIGRPTASPTSAPCSC
jgi:hypothetical protein